MGAKKVVTCADYKIITTMFKPIHQPLYVFSLYIWLTFGKLCRCLNAVLTEADTQRLRISLNVTSDHMKPSTGEFFWHFKRQM